MSAYDTQKDAVLKRLSCLVEKGLLPLRERALCLREKGLCNKMAECDGKNVGLCLMKGLRAL